MAASVSWSEPTSRPPGRTASRLPVKRRTGAREGRGREEEEEDRDAPLHLAELSASPLRRKSTLFSAQKAQAALLRNTLDSGEHRADRGGEREARGGGLTLAELCPEDKQRVARLIRELAAAGECSAVQRMHVCNGVRSEERKSRVEEEKMKKKPLQTLSLPLTHTHPPRPFRIGEAREALEEELMQQRTEHRSAIETLEAKILRLEQVTTTSPPIFHPPSLPPLPSSSHLARLCAPNHTQERDDSRGRTKIAEERAETAERRERDRQWNRVETAVQTEDVSTSPLNGRRSAAGSPPASVWGQHRADGDGSGAKEDEPRRRGRESAAEPSAAVSPLLLPKPRTSPRPPAPSEPLPHARPRLEQGPVSSGLAPPQWALPVSSAYAELAPPSPPLPARGAPASGLNWGHAPSHARTADEAGYGRHAHVHTYARPPGAEEHRRAAAFAPLPEPRYGPPPARPLQLWELVEQLDVSQRQFSPTLQEEGGQGPVARGESRGTPPAHDAMALNALLTGGAR
jgi:hypothetical protein